MARVYATPDELTTELGLAAAPDNADYLLKHASRLVDGLLVGAVYKIDEQQMPTNTAVRDALREATLAQAAYWHYNGTPAEGGSRWGNVSIGSVSLSNGESPTHAESDGQTVAPSVLTGLHVAGLLPVRPYVVG
ncbi:hypothetical protein [Actinopolyspora halophila]|uniref:hypothetical protein n=1 Tax=Actinopolyspora halophila TaxID=1850 RepID=UPI00037A6E9B|nr:hypothetical protein [Actinopolyspora halophila]